MIWNMGWIENELRKIDSDIVTFLIQQKPGRERGFFEVYHHRRRASEDSIRFHWCKCRPWQAETLRTRQKSATTASSKSWNWREALTDLTRSHDQCVRYTIVVASRRDYDLQLAFHTGELSMLIEAQWGKGSNIWCLFLFSSTTKYDDEERC